MLQVVQRLHRNLFWSLGPIILQPNIDRRIPLYETRPTTLKHKKWDPVISILTALRRDNEPRCVQYRSRLRTPGSKNVFVKIRMHGCRQTCQTLSQKQTCKTDSSQPNWKARFVCRTPAPTPTQRWAAIRLENLWHRRGCNSAPPILKCVFLQNSYIQFPLYDCPAAQNACKQHQNGTVS